MNIITEDGQELKINLGKYFGKEKLNCSKLHWRLREFLSCTFPAAHILEEVYIPNYDLFLDFYIPLYTLACESDGFQHSDYTPFFHKTKFGFAKAKGRDNKKARFCELNRITLIRFGEAEDEGQWLKKLNDVLKK